MPADGVFPAVALSGGLGTLAVRQGDPRVPGWLVVYRFLVTAPTVLTAFDRFDLPAGSPCFPGLYVLDGLTWLAFHNGQGQRLKNLTTGREVLAVDGLSNPSAFGAGCFAYTEPVQPYRVHRLNLRTGEVDQPRLGAPTGLSRILEDGQVVTIDEDRHALAGATIPAFAGPLSVGEGPSGGVVWTHASGASGVLYAGRDSFTPKCAADGDTFAITTAGPDVRLFCGSLAALITASGQPLFGDKKPGPIVNTEETSPMLEAKPLPADVHAIVVELYAFNLALAHGSDDDRRALQQKICETVRARKGPAWGWKSNHGVGIANAKDAIAAIPENDGLAFGDRQPLYMWDVFNGTSRAPNPLPIMSETEHVEQFFVPVQPIDHLTGSVTEPDPVKPPPGDSPVDLAPLLARIAALEAATRKNSGDTLRLAETVDILKSRPAPSFDLEAALAGYEVSGRTGRDRLGLQHDVRLGITKRTS